MKRKIQTIGRRKGESMKKTLPEHNALLNQNLEDSEIRVKPAKNFESKLEESNGH